MKSLHFLKKDDFDEEADWRDLDALPSEVVSKKELGDMQANVVSELSNLQKDGIAQDSSNNPQALFYYHKYIDSKFNKQDFDVDTYFSKKQNIVDKKYAEGIGELNEEFTGYSELISQIKEAERRLLRKLYIIDPEAKEEATPIGEYDDSEEILTTIQNLPKEINWNDLEGKLK